jgi:5-formyltetrahydrofolate cyclo-ligase
VIVPALAVDRRGVRLGRGGGSYDRALSRVPVGTPIVAALYDGELLDALPADPHDVRVTGVATPAGLVRL